MLLVVDIYEIQDQPHIYQARCFGSSFPGEVVELMWQNSAVINFRLIVHCTVPPPDNYQIQEFPAG